MFSNWFTIPAEYFPVDDRSGARSEVRTFTPERVDETGNRGQAVGTENILQNWPRRTALSALVATRRNPQLLPETMTCAGGQLVYGTWCTKALYSPDGGSCGRSTSLAQLLELSAWQPCRGK